MTEGPIQKIMRNLVRFFGDERKAALWLEVENPLLGGLRPWDMIAAGRVEKLAKFVEEQLEENGEKT